MPATPATGPRRPPPATSTSSSASTNAAGENNQPQRPANPFSSDCGSTPRKRIARTFAQADSRRCPRLMRALQQLIALSGCVGEDQAALVQSSQEGMDAFQWQPERREPLLETGLDRRQAGLTVEHFQDGVFFVAEVEVLQRHRVFNEPIAVLPVRLGHDRQVGPAGKGEWINAAPRFAFSPASPAANSVPDCRFPPARGPARVDWVDLRVDEDYLAGKLG